MIRRLLPVAAVAVAAVGLAWPASPPGVVPPAEATPFRWDADELFRGLEEQFRRMAGTSLEDARRAASLLETELDAHLRTVAGSPDAQSAGLEALAVRQFEYAVLAAAHPELLPAAQAFMIRARVAVMRAAASWPTDRATHELLYRVVFGGRIALEEALVQAGPTLLPELVLVESIPSATPYLDVEGVRVHSGDILLSRGGAPTSALIARGSDFANTFSHAALVHVDAETGVGTVVESLIETGSVLSTVEEYLASKKHRIVVLRLRPDHPALASDPLLPHRAASAMLQRLSDEPVPYDFAMAWQDAARMFCSEVVHHAYDAEGVALWPIRSSMTAPGLVRWLGAMGVREFTTLVPSDLEYDAQVRAVAEWRNAEALLDYRRDNAITDVLLEAADQGAELGYPWYALPVARLVAAAVPFQSWVGASPTIPRGMSADAALRVDALVSTVSPTLLAELVEREGAFLEANGFRAPYWTLVALARESLAANREPLEPSLRGGS